MNRLFQEIRESENRAKARRLQALGRFHVGDVAYPIGIRGDLNMWGIVVDINIPAHKVILNLNGLVRQFEPDELLLTNPEEKEGNREVEDKERVKRVVEETVGKAFAANRRERIASRIAAAMANRKVAARPSKATLELGFARVVPGSGKSYAESDSWYDTLLIKSMKGLPQEEAIADMKQIAPEMRFTNADRYGTIQVYEFHGRVRLRADNLIRKAEQLGYRVK